MDLVDLERALRIRAQVGELLVVATQVDLERGAEEQEWIEADVRLAGRADGYEPPELLARDEFVQDIIGDVGVVVVDRSWADNSSGVMRHQSRSDEKR